MRGRRLVTSLVLSISTAAALLILGCGTLDNIVPPSGGTVCGTEVPDPTELVVGCLVDESDRPAAGIIVLATLSNSLAKAGIIADTVVHADTTDTLGRYSFSSLKQSAYIITANDDDTLRSMRPRRVESGPGSSTWLGTDTLYRNGMVEGQLLAHNTLNPLPFVVCEVLDWPFAAKSDGNGRFSLILPPHPNYVLECAGNHRALMPTRTMFQVLAGETTLVTLGLLNKLDVEVPPRAPDTAYASYDAVTGIVHLSWPPVTPRLSGSLYFVQRIDTTYYGAKTFFTPDTFYDDAIPWPRGEDGRILANSKSVRYNVGLTFPNSHTTSANWVTLVIPVDPPRFLGPEVAVKTEGDKTAFQVGDTARVVGTWRNLYRTNRLLAWTLDSTGAELKPHWDLVDTAGTDTLVYPCTSPGTFRVRFKVTDVSGAAASALQVIDVTPAP